MDAVIIIAALVAVALVWGAAWRRRNRDTKAHGGPGRVDPRPGGRPKPPTA